MDTTDLIGRLQSHLRQLAPHQRERETAVLLQSSLDKLREFENERTKASEELAELFDIFHIGSGVRDMSTLKQNIINSARRSNCLSRIEIFHTAEELDDDGEVFEDSLLNWGQEPEQYAQTYADVIMAREKKLLEELALVKEERDRFLEEIDLHKTFLRKLRNDLHCGNAPSEMIGQIEECLVNGAASVI